ncbi:MAG: hypothetical protein Q8P44_10105 [Dehalococcoidia bacterium]|nr:hypothetical protein [Dehalococcoidia bacterium]
MGRKDQKRQQRAAYKRAFAGVKHNRGSLSIRKKEESALGRK